MAYRYTPRKTSGYVYAAAALAAAVTLFPLSISQTDFRAAFARGLAVAANKSSPAYAAFEDLRENYSDDELQIPERGAVLLAAGEKLDLQKLQTLPRQRYVVMRGLTLHRPVVVEPKPYLVAGLSVRPKSEVAAVPLPMPAPTHRQLYADEAPSAVPSITSGTDYETVHATRATAPSAAAALAHDDGGLKVATAGPAGGNSLWLNGQIEMTGGLAFVGPETQISVKRVYNGQPYENGRIWVTEGKFEIYVKKASGYLLAELFTRDGRVLGRGELNLVDLSGVASANGRIGDLRIALHPATDTASMRTVSGYSSGSGQTALADARVQVQSYGDSHPVNEDGTVSEPTLAQGSTFVAQASAKKNWSSLVIAQSGHPQDIRVFSNSMMEALINIASRDGTTKAEAFHSAIVWGQVSREGQSVADATVEMAGDQRPIYFNEAYIPDPSLTATSRNGLFAFIHVATGVQAVRVRQDGRMYPAQVFPTEEKHVSYLELDLRDHVVSQFRVSDVLDMNRPVPAHVKLVGTDAQLEMHSEESVQYAVAGDTFMVEAAASDEYEVSRTTLTGSPQLVVIPMVKRQWLHDLADKNSVPYVPGRGTVVGFVDDVDFSVAITGLQPAEAMQIIYFDRDGRALPAGSNGVAGGGFAIFNAPAGLQTVYVHARHSTQTYSQVVVSEPEYVHVLTWSGPRL